MRAPVSCSKIAGVARRGDQRASVTHAENGAGN